tara:strand:- start:861 stop:1280 length:420 start_codon:yes stop_codon:yes gene_type:complete
MTTYFKNPFITRTDIFFAKTEIFKRLTATDLILVTFKNVNIRIYDPDKPSTIISKGRLIEADIRYPPIVYESKFDPLRGDVTRRYCIFDGTHRILKMKHQGLTAGVCFLMDPKVFIGLKEYKNPQLNPARTTGCGGCGE